MAWLAGRHLVACLLLLHLVGASHQARVGSLPATSDVSAALAGGVRPRSTLEVHKPAEQLTAHAAGTEPRPNDIARRAATEVSGARLQPAVGAPCAAHCARRACQAELRHFGWGHGRARKPVHTAMCHPAICCTPDALRGMELLLQPGPVGSGQRGAQPMQTLMPCEGDAWHAPRPCVWPCMRPCMGGMR